MTAEEAREALARDNAPAVVFRPPGGEKAEDGVITSVGEKWVFVCYGRGTTSAATDPACLTLLATPEPGDSSEEGSGDG
jgi:hypothetical protein